MIFVKFALDELGPNECCVEFKYFDKQVNSVMVTLMHAAVKRAPNKQHNKNATNIRVCRQNLSILYGRRSSSDKVESQSSSNALKLYKIILIN